MSESQDKKFEAPVRNAMSLLGDQSAQITFDNMTKLCNQSEYKIADEVYKRRILKPKELVKLYKLQTDLDKIKDPEKRMENLYEQAEICLEGVTPEKWENTDAVKMEIVLGACLLISKGFRQI
jgi:gamma-glutamyl phosphate reductase